MDKERTFRSFRQGGEAQQVYHVVTERPMSVGQKLFFGALHHNGVYDRVTTFQRVLGGEAVHGQLADMIRANMEQWGKVAYRELALETVRAERFPHLPSRMACLYTSRTFAEAEKWAEFFQSVERKVYAIVKLRVAGSVFDGDACLCFDGTGDEKEDIPKALRYWRMDAATEKPVIETLAAGEITVEEIVRAY